MADDVIKGIIGDGIITELILTAITKQTGKNPAEFYVSCKTQESCKQFRDHYNANAVIDPMEFLPKVKILVIALPIGENIESELIKINKKIPKDTLVVSCTYALTIKMLEEYFPNHPVIRTMMNPMILIGEGICIYTVGSVKSANSEIMAKLFLSQFGKTIKMSSDEELELAGNLIIGSTIYSLLAVNSLIEGANNSGLNTEKSTEIVSQVFSGVSKIICESDEVIENLRKKFSENKNFVERAKEILMNYDILKLMNNQLPKTDEREIFKFHYRWGR